MNGSILNFYSANHVDPPLAHVLVGLALLGFLYTIGFALYQAAIARRRGRAADASYDADAILAPGRTFVKGVVELAADHEIAIKVAITQHGTERRHKNSWSHRWTEVARSTQARPFYVKRRSGERIRVEPDVDVLLVDSLDMMQWDRRTHRVREAELTAGEVVIVEGMLDYGQDPELRPTGGGGGYRDPMHRGWIMRAPDDARLLVSAQPLGKTHRERARRLNGSAMWAFLLLALSQLGLVAYYERVFSGTPRIAEVYDRDHWTTRGSKGSTHHHYSVTVRFLDDGSAFEDEVSHNVYEDVRVDDRAVVRWVRSHASASSFGKNSSVNFFALVVLFLCWGGALYFVVKAHRTKPWYEGKVIESGRGRLPAPHSI